MRYIHSSKLAPIVFVYDNFLLKKCFGNLKKLEHIFFVFRHALVYSQYFRINSICQRNKQLRHMHIAQLPTNDLETIIKSDFARLVTPTETVQRPTNVPLGWRTPLGWPPCDRDSAAKPDDINTTNFIDGNQLFRLNAEWMKDEAEVVSLDKQSFSRDDKHAIQILEATTHLLDNGHYQIGL